MKILFPLLAGLVLASSDFAPPSYAQSSPGWAAGNVPTATQWNSQWASKADAASPTITGTLTASGNLLVGGDWLSAESAAGLTWPVPAAQSAALSQSGKIALTAASRASDLSSSYGSLQTTIGTASIAVNDDPYATSARHVTVYGGYDEAQTIAGAYGLSFGREIDASNLSGLAPALSTPASPLSDGTSGTVSGTTASLWLAAGGGHSNASDASFAVGIKDNGARFQTGILFGANALTNYSGFSYAMRMPKGALLQWHDASDATGPNIGSTVATAANAMSMQFQDGGTLFLNPGASTIGFEIQSQIGAVNGLEVQPVVAGASPQIMAEGSDSNIGINLVPKGSGAVYTPAGISAASLYTSGNATVIGTATLNTLASSGVTITGGTINGTSVGATTAGTGAFTTLAASSTVSGTGFSTYLASPPAIGGTTPAAGKFTTLATTSTSTLGGNVAVTGTLSASGATTLSSALAVTGAATFSAAANIPRMIATGSVPTLSGTCSTGTQAGGNTAGSFKFSSACSAGTVIMTFAAAATNGWACKVQDMTTPADALNQTAYTTTTATITGTAASGDQTVFQCVGF